MIYLLWQKFNNSHFLKFLFVGILNTLVGYGTFVLLIIFGGHYFLAATFSHIIGVLHSYFWNKFFTFKSSRKSAKEPIKFIFVYSISFLVNIFLLWAFVGKMGFSAIFVQIFVLPIVTLISFFGFKYWTFRHV